MQDGKRNWTEAGKLCVSYAFRYPSRTEIGPPVAPEIGSKPIQQDGVHRMPANGNKTMLNTLRMNVTSIMYSGDLRVTLTLII